ncbi:hypothetical protein [Kitasatospora sp. McL0602]|uniref:hypothetical protein n=1 Tax=Kitasatospora sp. McL0602 TaxID=3439530 RepID=UPI003F897DEE
MRHHIIGTALITAALLGTGSAAFAATPRSVSDYRGVFGGRYASYNDCVSSGSLGLGMGLYSHYECDPIPGGANYNLYYR